MQKNTSHVPSGNPETVFLVDGSGYIYRAFHAIRHLSNANGMPTNAIFGFTRMLIKLLKDRSPRSIAIFFDAKGPTFRHKIYPEYKANRPPMPEDLRVQIPYIKKVTAAFHLANFEHPGYEADDLIGTATRTALAAGCKVVIVSGDKDLKQLISEDVLLWDPMKNQATDLADLRQAGIEPFQLTDIMGLSGDASDNIPGVPGIGPKTALKLIKTYGHMENLYRHVEEITQPKLKQNLLQFKDQAFLSKQLVAIDTQVPLTMDIGAFKAMTPDRPALSNLFKELEFRQLQKEFFQPPTSSPKAYHCIRRLGDLENLIQRLNKAEFVAIDTETTSINPMQAELVGFSVCFRAHEAYYIPCGHTVDPVENQIPLALAIERLKPFFENAAIFKIGQNVKYDGMVLARHGVQLSGLAFDTMLASYLINPSKRAHSLDQIALDFLNYQTTTYEEVVGQKSKDIGFNQVPIEKAVPYACEDADITFLAYEVLNAEIEALGLSHLLKNVEIPLIVVLMNMEMTGVALDKDMLRQLSSHFEHQLAQIEDRIYDEAGERFNIKSPQQLGSILFEKLGLPTQKKTRKKTGYSTDIEVLTHLAEHHALPALILRHRMLSKLKSTYVDALLDLVHPDTGRIHTSYHQTVTATGRLSSSNPNLQNIPIRTDEGQEIRKAFIAPKGCLLLSADYSQIELRILAHYSQDPILLNAFADDEDIHSRTAAEVFEVQPAQVTPELRRQAKIINFGIIYGMSPFGLGKSLGISQTMAKTMIDHYFERYEGVKAFIERTIHNARQEGRSSTLLGRIRRLPDINARNANLRHFAERTAVNTPIQGTAADLIKIAMIRVHRAIADQGLATRMLLSVHDELVFEVPLEERRRVHSTVKDCMENVWDLKVPLKVNIAEGENWSAAH